MDNNGEGNLDMEGNLDLGKNFGRESALTDTLLNRDGNGRSYYSGRQNSGHKVFQDENE
jgi:hypothetical protein